MKTIKNTVKFVLLFSMYLLSTACSDVDRNRYPELIKGQFASTNKTHRIDLIFGDKKVVVSIGLVGITLDKHYRLIENNQYLLIDGFKNYHKIHFIDEDSFELLEDSTRMGKRGSPLNGNTYQRIE